MSRCYSFVGRYLLFALAFATIGLFGRQASAEVFLTKPLSQVHGLVAELYARPEGPPTHISIDGAVFQVSRWQVGQSMRQVFDHIESRLALLGNTEERPDALSYIANDHGILSVLANSLAENRDRPIYSIAIVTEELGPSLTRLVISELKSILPMEDKEVGERIPNETAPVWRSTEFSGKLQHNVEMYIHELDINVLRQFRFQTLSANATAPIEISQSAEGLLMVASKFDAETRSFTYVDEDGAIVEILTETSGGRPGPDNR